MSKVIRWSPLVPDFFEEADRFFGSSGLTAGSTLPVNIYQTKDSVVVEAQLPGVNPEDIDISVAGDVLTIRGASEHKSEIDDENYYRREVRTGSFYRSVTLPTHVADTAAEASYEQGVLTVRFPKAPGAKAKRIAVKSARR